MYYRSQKPPYQKYVLYTAVLAVAVALVIFGGKALKSELEEAKATAANPDQDISNNYSAIENSSQENQSDSSYNAGSKNSETGRETGSKSDSSSTRGDSSSGSSEPSEDDDDYYTITTYEGNIAVFKNDEEIPITVLDKPVSYFPEEDQKLLEAGIRVSTLNEAMQVLEDYH